MFFAMDVITIYKGKRVFSRVGTIFIQRERYYMMTVSVCGEYERRGRCFRAGLGVLIMGLGERARGLGGQYIGPIGEAILAVEGRLAHLEGGR